MKETISIKQLIDSQVVSNILDAGGEVFFVGGCVRDTEMGRTPKDIDVMVRLIEPEQLQSILLKTGTVKLVGESFGVFIYNDPAGFEIEVALPRSDSKGEGKGHTSIIAQTDKNLPLRTDLRRRDFTCNAMAFDINMNIVDPFNGRADIARKILRAVDDAAFPDDPLRIIRGVRFAIQLGFEIELHTLHMMWSNVEELDSISPERKLMEIEKMIAARPLSSRLEDIILKTKTAKGLFGVEFTSFNCFGMHFRFVGELLHVIPNVIGDKVEFFKLNLTIDGETEKIMRAIEHLEKNTKQSGSDNAMVIFEALQIAKNDEILESKFFDVHGSDRFRFQNCPTHKHKIALTGKHLVEMGLKGQEIGEVHLELLSAMFRHDADNTVESLSDWLRNGTRPVIIK